MPTRKRTRLEGWNYSAPYVELTEFGACVQDSLLFLSKDNSSVFPEKWVIMPNHVHILVRRNEALPLAQGASGMPRPTNEAVPKFVSSLKRFTNRKTGSQLWQNGYYDHIVRNEPDYLRIWQYIDNNPAVWLEDKYYSE